MAPDFGKSFFKKHQTNLVKFANSRFGHWFFRLDKVGIPRNFYIFEVFPNAVSGDWKIKDGKLNKTTVFFTSPRLQRRFEYVYRRAAQLLPFSAVTIERLMLPHPSFGFLPLFALTVSTFNPDPNPETTSVDGEVTSGNGTVWATQRGLADGASADDAGTTGNQIAAQFFTPNYSLARGFFLFDTSTIGDDDTIDSAVLSLKGAFSTTNADSSSNVIVATTPASNTAITTADYDQVGTTSFGSHALSAWSTSAYNDITLNASGLAAITKTGVSKFGARNSRDFDNVAPTGGNDSYFLPAGSASEPKLAVTHSSAGTISPPTLLTMGVG